MGFPQAAQNSSVVGVDAIWGALGTPPKVTLIPPMDAGALVWLASTRERLMTLSATPPA